MYPPPTTLLIYCNYSPSQILNQGLFAQVTCTSHCPSLSATDKNWIKILIISKAKTENLKVKLTVKTQQCRYTCRSLFINSCFIFKNLTYNKQSLEACTLPGNKDYIGTCSPKRYGFFGLFWSEIRYQFWPFWSHIGMVFAL